MPNTVHLLHLLSISSASAGVSDKQNTGNVGLTDFAPASVRPVSEEGSVDVKIRLEEEPRLLQGRKESQCLSLEGSGMQGKGSVFATKAAEIQGKGGLRHEGSGKAKAVSSPRGQWKYKAKAASSPRRQWKCKAKAVSSPRRQWKYKAKAVPYAAPGRSLPVEKLERVVGDVRRLIRSTLDQHASKRQEACTPRADTETARH